MPTAQQTQAEIREQFQQENRDQRIVFLYGVIAADHDAHDWTSVRRAARLRVDTSHMA